jgi:hypothetical protein
MKYVRIFYKDGIEFQEPLQASDLAEIKLIPGETILSYYDDGKLYGAFGAMYATQADSSRQIELTAQKEGVK